MTGSCDNDDFERGRVRARLDDDVAAMFRRTSTPSTPSPSTPRRSGSDAALGSPSNGRPRQLPVHEPYKEPPCVRRGMQVLSSRQYDLHIHSARGQLITALASVPLSFCLVTRSP